MCSIRKYSDSKLFFVLSLGNTRDAKTKMGWGPQTTHYCPLEGGEILVPEGGGGGGGGEGGIVPFTQLYNKRQHFVVNTHFNRQPV